MQRGMEVISLLDCHDIKEAYISLIAIYLYRAVCGAPCSTPSTPTTAATLLLSLLILIGTRWSHSLSGVGEIAWSSLQSKPRN